MHNSNSAVRVALRFAASRPMKPEKMQALLLKIRKGATSGLRMPELVQVIEYLGGWTIGEGLGLEALHFNLGHGNVSKINFTGTPAEVEAEWKKAKDNEYSVIPSLDQLVEHKVYYQDVGPVKDSTRPGVAYFGYLGWRAVKGVKVTSPNHKVFQTTQREELFLKDYPQNNGLLKWLLGETPFLAQVNEKLGLDSIEEEKERKRKEVLKLKLTDDVGTCSCCFGHFKLASRNKLGKDKTMPGMVLHGYKRPGTGYINGNCFGQDYPPFEISREGTDAFVEYLKPLLKRGHEYIASLKSGKIKVLIDRRSLTDFTEVKPGDPDWEKTLRIAIDKEANAIASLENALKSCERELVGWKPTALPELGGKMRRNPQL